MASETSNNGWKKAPKIPYPKFHIIMIMINRSSVYVNVRNSRYPPSAKGCGPVQGADFRVNFNKFNAKYFTGILWMPERKHKTHTFACITL